MYPVVCSYVAVLGSFIAQRQRKDEVAQEESPEEGKRAGLTS